jgi:hypothetical protein
VKPLDGCTYTRYCSYMNTNTATETVSLYRFTFQHRIPMQAWAANMTEAHALVSDDAARFTITGVEVV